MHLLWLNPFFSSAVKKGRAVGHNGSHLSVGLIKRLYLSVQTLSPLFQHGYPRSTVEQPAVPFSHVISEAMSWALTGVTVWSTLHSAALLFSASLTIFCCLANPWIWFGVSALQLRQQKELLDSSCSFSFGTGLCLPERREFVWLILLLCS